MPPKKMTAPRAESDEQPDELRREDQATIAPDSLPDGDGEIIEDESTGAHSLAEDGGSGDHPIHDDDPSEDFTPRDYEEQIEQVAKAQARRDQRKRTDVEEP